MRKNAIYELIIGIFLNVIGGIALIWILNDPLITVLVLSLMILVSALVFLFLRIEEIRKSANALEKNANQSCQCCGLFLAGFSQVFVNAKDSRRLTLDLTSNYFYFLGVTGEFVVGSQQDAKELRDIIKRKVKDEGCHFQFLLLDPEANEAIERHATQEGSTKEAIALEIKQTIEHLRILSRECGAGIEVWLYHRQPIFRVVIVDDEHLFVSYYGAKGIGGITTPQLVFHKTGNSYFTPFLNFYKETLRDAKQLI